jgi:hypothetical protein
VKAIAGGVRDAVVAAFDGSAGRERHDRIVGQQRPRHAALRPRRGGEGKQDRRDDDDQA